MNLGVYAWIRECVRRAVLLGFSDAVEQLGAPVEGDDLNPRLAAVLRQPKPLSAAPTEPARSAAPGPSGRKRLGQTLDQIQQKASKAAD